MSPLDEALPTPAPTSATRDTERRVIEAARRCCERWGISKVTIDDIAAESGVSRATLYRLFPGGRDTLFEAMRVCETEEFLTALTARLRGAEDLEGLLVRGVVEATRALQADEHLQLMLLSEPGAVASELTVEGLPRIISITSAFLAPFLGPWVGERSDELAEWLTRTVISFFLVPSAHVDLADRESAARFVRRFLLPAFDPTTTRR